MRIGENLAQARLAAGLSIEQVSRLTCIRETIIREIEHDDFHRCGGDFYARGHIRAIAATVGTDARPLIAEFDAAGTEPAFGAASPVWAPGPSPAPQPPPALAPEPAPDRAPRPRPRARLNWSLALSLALLLAVSFGGYKAADYYLHGSGAAAMPQTDGVSAMVPDRRHAGHRKARSDRRHRAVVIELTATGSCWVRLATRSGRVLFSGLVPAGGVQKWTERRAVQLRLGDPAAVRLSVNGHRRTSIRDQAAAPVTLALGPQRRARQHRQ